MRIDLDTYHELLETLLRNKTRSFLTGFGVFWGVFMLVALIGGGSGMKEMLSNNFEGPPILPSSGNSRPPNPSTVFAKDVCGS